MSQHKEKENRTGILFPIALTVLLCIVIIIPGINNADEVPETLVDLYTPVSANNYVIGQYNPAKHPDFVELTTLGIPVGNPKQYLRKQAAQSLKSMLTDFGNTHPEVKVWVESAARSYQRQKSIWVSKWQGNVSVEGKNLAETIIDPYKRAKQILKFSAMPGASRHHWGTEIDFNLLRNDYYDKGNGKILYDWLKQNALRYEFCQPYTAQRSEGHLEERWHWSYRPLARQFQKDWNRLFFNNRSRKMEILDFSGSESALKLADTYINHINQQCK
ncbi:MAG: M15 family metallopeptidase [Gammaproteobacteria bacterium]|nr:MAG: M15 family metallopeptidase [Gammaproteobacteria bacterium]